MAALPDDTLAKTLFARIASSAWGNGESVTAIRATNRHGEEIVILHNWSSTQATTVIPVDVEDVLTAGILSSGSTLTMPAWDVRVLAVTAPTEVPQA